MPKQKEQHKAHTPRTMIIVPCYNEAKRMYPALFLKFLENGNDIGFVFVNDGSKDQTAPMLERLRNKCPDRVTVLHLIENSGKDEAVRTGLIYALEQKPDFVGYWDADLASPLAELPAMLKIITNDKEIQCVYGARIKLLGHKVKRTLLRRAVSFCCRVLAQSALDLPVTDTQCGAKIFRASRELNEALLSPFTAGWLFDVELFARLKIAWNKANPGLYEHPLTEWQEVSGSNVSMIEMLGAGLTMLGLILRMRVGLFRPTQTTIKSEYSLSQSSIKPTLKNVA